MIIIVAKITPFCPQAEIARAVTRAAAAVFTSALPSSMVERNFSGAAIILSTAPAPLTRVLTRCSRLTFWSERKAVSEPENSPDSSTKTTIRTREKTSMPVMASPRFRPFGRGAASHG